MDRTESRTLVARLMRVRLKQRKDSSGDHSDGDDPPISRLPSELLCAIFQRLADSFIIEPTDISITGVASGFPYKWISVTQVCQLWHEVALDTPSLWTYVGPHGATTTRSLLALSKSAPLVVDITSVALRPTHDALISSFGSISKHLARVADLRLDVRDEDRGLDLVPFIYSLQALESLSLRNAGRMRFLTFELDFPLPCLRSLDLTNCFIPWNSPSFRDLRFLAIRSASHIQLPQPSLQELLTVISHCAGLETLALSGIGTKAYATERTSMGAITLPFLRDLSLSMDLSDFTTLLRHIITPAVTNWILSIVHSDGSLPSITPVFVGSEILCRSIQLFLGGESALAIGCYEPLPMFRHRQYTYRCPTLDVTDFPRVIESARWNTATMLDIHMGNADSVRGVSASSWVTLLSGLPRLQTIKLAPAMPPFYVVHCTTSLLKALTLPSSENNAGQRAGSIVCPELLYLDLGGHIAECVLNEKSTKDHTKDLVNCLKRRQESGHRLSKLRIEIRTYYIRISQDEIRQYVDDLVVVDLYLLGEMHSYPYM